MTSIRSAHQGGSLVHRTALASTPDCDADGGRLRAPGDIVSDRGSSGRTVGDGRVLIDTPRHQAVIGRTGRRATTNVVVDLETPFAAVQVASLADAPLARAERLLLLTAARSANTGMRWLDDTRRSLGQAWGHAPTRIEPVTGRITLRETEGRRRAVNRSMARANP